MNSLVPILARIPNDSHAPRAWWLCTLSSDSVLYTGASTRPPRLQMPMPNPSAAPPHSPPYASISRGFLKIEWAAGRIFSVVLEYLYK